MLNLIRSIDIASELGVPQNVVYESMVELVNEESKKATFVNYLLNDDEKAVYVFDHSDVNYLLEGSSGGENFVSISEKYGLDYDVMNWVLIELFKRKVINFDAFNYYRTVKYEPDISLYFKPDEVDVGDWVSLVVDVKNYDEIVNPFFELSHPEDLVLRYKPELPDIISEGKRVDTFQFKCEAPGNYEVALIYGGRINEVEWREEYRPEEKLIVKAFPPRFNINVVDSSVNAVYNRATELKYVLYNGGKGAANNIELVNLEEYDQFKVVSGKRIEFLDVGSRIEHTLKILVNKKEDFVLDNLCISYTDDNEVGYSMMLPEIKVNTVVERPHLGVEFDSPRVIEYGASFPFSLSILNNGKGSAYNVRMEVDIQPREAQIQGQLIYNVDEFLPDTRKTIDYVLKGVHSNKLVFTLKYLECFDESGEKIREEDIRYVILVENKDDYVKTVWPFKEDQVIDNRYRIIEELDEGSFAVVYKVEDVSQLSDDPIVYALKALKPKYSKNVVTVKDFIEEATVLRDLRSDYILRYYSSGIVDYRNRDYPYIIMEYQSKTLGDILNQRKLELYELCYLNRDLCTALFDAQSSLGGKILVHGDLKPSNIFYDEADMIWKLGDFGVAKILSRERVRASGRNLEYSANELFEDPPTISRASDVYSLGVIYREALTGSTRGRLEMILDNEVYEKQLRVRIVDMLEQMLSHDPDDRPRLETVYRDIWDQRTMKLRNDEEVYD